MIFFSAFFLGLMGSLHCLGMCGPLALALPFSPDGSGQAKGGRYWLGHTIYNSGRIATYSMLGAGLGGAGWLIILSGWQQQISIVAGMCILLILIMQSRSTLPFAGVSRLNSFVQKAFGNLISSKPGPITYFGFGLANGLLPCGLVYVAFAGSAWAGSVLGGAMFMALFGLGTLPMMMFAGSISHFIRPLFYRQALRVISFIVAGLLIVRGLGLDIPYLSPKRVVPATQASISVCH